VLGINTSFDDGFQLVPNPALAQQTGLWFHLKFDFIMHCAFTTLRSYRHDALSRNETPAARCKLVCRTARVIEVLGTWLKL